MPPRKFVGIKNKDARFHGRLGEKVGPEILVMAHMDEIGLMVTGIEENGMLRMMPVGGVDPRVLPGSEVLVLGEKPLPGVIGAIPPHLTTGKTGAAYRIEDLTCDVGYPAEQVRAFISGLNAKNRQKRQDIA